jgi:septum formation protein
MPTSPRLILATQSPQRFALFTELHLPFDQVPADVNEQDIQDPDLVKRAELVARAKAEKVARDYPDAIVIAADTYIILEGRALEKPVGEADAIRMLELQSGRQTVEVTGLCYLDPKRDLEVAKTIITNIWFRDLSLAEIKHYVAHNPVTGFSGAFCPAYASGAALIARIEGSFTSFTHGLPLDEIVPLLRQSGVEV